MLIIGLTGGIGSGKTTVSDCFAALGVPVIDSDKIAREVVQPGQPALRQIVQLFGKAILTNNGELDRRQLRSIVFTDPGKRQQLEAILHPVIKQTIHQQISQLHCDYCIIVVPLLLESGWQDFVERILVVDVPQEIQIERTIERDNSNRELLTAILASQVTRQNRLEAADDVIDNTGNIDAIKSQVAQLHRKYTALATSNQT